MSRLEFVSVVSEEKIFVKDYKILEKSCQTDMYTNLQLCHTQNIVDLLLIFLEKQIKTQKRFENEDKGRWNLTDWHVPLTFILYTTYSWPTVTGSEKLS